MNFKIAACEGGIVAGVCDVVFFLLRSMDGILCDIFNVCEIIRMYKSV